MQHTVAGVVPPALGHGYGCCQCPGSGQRLQFANNCTRLCHQVQAVRLDVDGLKTHRPGRERPSPSDLGRGKGWCLPWVQSEPQHVDK
jgi:hypothetical protein